jgi:hypothetical protein
MSPTDMQYATKGEQVETYEDAIEQDQKRPEEVRQHVNEHSSRMKEKQAHQYFNKGRRDITYEPGQLVLIKAHPISSAAHKYAAKLAAPWLGPWEVIRMFNDVDIELRDV